MADIIDKANDLADTFNNSSLEKFKAKNAPTPGIICRECEIELEEHRKQYGICVDCQEELEAIEKRKKVLGV